MALCQEADTIATDNEEEAGSSQAMAAKRIRVVSESGKISSTSLSGPRSKRTPCQAKPTGNEKVPSLISQSCLYTSLNVYIYTFIRSE